MGTTQKQTRLRGRTTKAENVQLKARSGPVSVDDKTDVEIKPIIGNEPTQQVASVPELFMRLGFFKHTKVASQSRKDRLEDLMARRIAKTWDAEKKQKMVRRLIGANKMLEQSVTAIDMIETEIQKQLASPPQTALAPFVPAAPTSV